MCLEFNATVFEAIVDSCTATFPILSYVILEENLAWIQKLCSSVDKDDICIFPFLIYVKKTKLILK